MATLGSVFNNVMIQLKDNESNKGETWNGDMNFKDITPGTASFTEYLLSFGNKLVNENKRKCTVRKSQPKLNYNFMDDLSEDLKDKILTNMTKLVSIINEEKDNISLIIY
jgi:activator of 2-hydroxyglutaryl-CoA dehydratase